MFSFGQADRISPSADQRHRKNRQDQKASVHLTKRAGRVPDSDPAGGSLLLRGARVILPDMYQPVVLKGGEAVDSGELVGSWHRVERKDSAFHAALGSVVFFWTIIRLSSMVTVTLVTGATSCLSISGTRNRVQRSQSNPSPQSPVFSCLLRSCLTISQLSPFPSFFDSASCLRLRPPKK